MGLLKILQHGLMEATTHVPTQKIRPHTKGYVVLQAKLKLLDKLLGEIMHGDISGDNQHSNNGGSRYSNNGDNQCNHSGDNQGNPNVVSQLNESLNGDNQPAAYTQVSNNPNTLLESFQVACQAEVCIQESHNKVCIQVFRDKEHKEFTLKDLRFHKSRSDLKSRS